VKFRVFLNGDALKPRTAELLPGGCGVEVCIPCGDSSDDGYAYIIYPLEVFIAAYTDTPTRNIKEAESAIIAQVVEDSLFLPVSSIREIIGAAIARTLELVDAGEL